MANKSVKYLGNIYIWEASVAYRREVEKVLARVRTTQAGQTLLRHINARSKWVLISPFHPTKAEPVNAYAAPRAAADSFPAGYVADTVKFNIPIFGGTVELPRLVGSGKGSHVDVLYHPATWHQMSKNMGHIPPGAGAGEIMFHELIHALRQMAGLMRMRDQVADEPAMDNVEEFYAIAASNVYRSERGFIKLRADHWGFNKLSGGLSYDASYYEQYKIYIDKWFGEQRAFCMDLAKSPAKFNPFREAAVELKLMPRPAVPMRL